MESPNNRRNLVDSPPVTARQMPPQRSPDQKPNSAQEGGDNIIESLPVLDMSNSVVEESDQVHYSTNVEVARRKMTMMHHHRSSRGCKIKTAIDTGIHQTFQPQKTKIWLG